MKNRRIIRSHYLWMRSYVIVSVVMIGILVALTTWMVNEFAEEVLELNHGLTFVLQTSIDTRLGDIDTFTAQLQMDPVNLKMSRIKKLDEIDKTALIRFSRQLHDYKLSNAFIKEIYIYYPHLDFVVGDLGYFGSEQYYLLKNDLSHNGYREWLGEVKNQDGSNWHFTGQAGGELELCMEKRLPYDLSGDKSAILTVTIDKREVEAILGNAKEGMGSTLAAVVSADNWVYANVGDRIDLNALKESLMANAGSPLFRFDGNYGSVMESGSYNIKYVTLIERHQLLNSGYFIRNIAYGAIGLSMIFGAALFALLGFKYARPLKEIMERLTNKSGSGFGGGMVNDYDLIGSELDQMYLKNAESSRKLKRQQEDIEGLFLCGLLNSQERSNFAIFASIQRFGIQMEYSLFQVGIIRYPWEGGDKVRKAAAVILAALEEKEDMTVITTEFSGDLVLLFHMEPEYGAEEMRLIAKEVEGVLNDAFHGAVFLLLFGGIYDSMSNIIVSYHQASLAAEFCQKERGGCHFYEEGMVAGRQEALRAFEGRGGGLTEEFIQRLSTEKDVSDMVKLLQEGLDSLIRRQQKRQCDQKENLAERAKQYVDLNFKDPMMGLYSVSDVLGVSNTYLSTTFKKTYGIGLVQYINTMRIACAKDLILHSDESIKEIALSVGFSSDAVFIRVFKQYENITPGRFKKNGLF